MAYVSIYEHPAFAAINPGLSRMKRAAIARRHMVASIGQSAADDVSNALTDIFGGGSSDASASDGSQQTEATQVVYGGTTSTDTGAAGGTSSDGGTGLTIPGPEGAGVQTTKPPPDVKPVIPPGGQPLPTVPTWVWVGGALVLVVGGIMVAHHVSTSTNPRRGCRRLNPRANPMRRMHHRRR